MTVAVFENEPQNHRKPAPPLTAGGVRLQAIFVLGPSRGYALGLCEDCHYS